MTVQAETLDTNKNTAPRRGRVTPNPVRFPKIVNVAVSQEIGAALDRAKMQFCGLGYTESDIVRLALFEWAGAKGFLVPLNGKKEANNAA
jgi:hypothetical protein